MFDSIVDGRQRAERRLGAGALLSIALHGVAVALALWLPTRVRAPAGPVGVEVAFLTAPSLEPAGGLGSTAEPTALVAEPRPASETQEPKAEPASTPRKTRTAKPERSAPVPETSPDVPTRPASAPSAAASGSAATQAARGPTGSSPTVSAVVGGQNHGSGRGAQPGAGLGSTVSPHRYEILPFGPGMTRPQLLGGRDPVYTRAARMARVEGTVIARCVITAQGRLEKCRIVKGQPHMDEAVLQALATRRYTPVTFQGHVQAVLYNVTISLRMRE
jgi:periplasmic protein TonB